MRNTWRQARLGLHIVEQQLLSVGIGHLPDRPRTEPRFALPRRPGAQQGCIYPGSAGTISATLCYMRSVTHREMRNNSGEILRAVAAGESVQVTNNGQVAAIISPPSGSSLSELVARGQARPARKPLSSLSAVSRQKASQTSADIVSESRGRW